MTTEDGHNLALRLLRQGDADAADAVLTLLSALELAGYDAAYYVPHGYTTDQYLAQAKAGRAE